MIVIRDGRGDTIAEFEGEKIAEVSTDDGEKARWIAFALYRKDSGGWVIHRLSESTVYHRADTTCRTQKSARPGVMDRAGQLRQNAEPCSICRPPEPADLDPDDPVRIEVPRHTVRQRDTEQSVVNDLVIDRRSGTPYWSEPVVELLVAAGMQHRRFLELIPQAEVRR